MACEPTFMLTKWALSMGAGIDRRLWLLVNVQPGSGKATASAATPVEGASLLSL